MSFEMTPTGPSYPGVLPRLTDALLLRPTAEFVFRGEVARRLPGWRFRWSPSGDRQGEATGPSGDTYEVVLAWPEGATMAWWSCACGAARQTVRRLADAEAENG